MKKDTSMLVDIKLEDSFEFIEDYREGIIEVIGTAIDEKWNGRMIVRMSSEYFKKALGKFKDDLEDQHE